MSEWQPDLNPTHTLDGALRAVLELLERTGEAYDLTEIKDSLARMDGWGPQLVQVATMYAIDTGRLVMCEDGLVRLDDTHRRHYVPRPGLDSSAR